MATVFQTDISVSHGFIMNAHPDISVSWVDRVKVLDTGTTEYINLVINKISIIIKRL